MESYISPDICTGYFPTIAKKWYVVDNLSYCRACMENGCIDKTNMTVQTATGTDRGILSRCYCKNITEHPRKNMGACVGDTRINYGTWYVPKGKPVEECSYCDWCVENGCIPKTDVEIVKSAVKNCNCDCQVEHPHLKKLCCPVCSYNEPGMLLMVCGNCVVCDSMTAYPHIKLCNACSHTLKLCSRCRLPIKSGDEYVSEITFLLRKRIADAQEKLRDLNQRLENRPKRRKTKNSNKESSDWFQELRDKWLPMEIGVTQASIEKYREDLIKIPEKYGGKTPQEMLEIITVAQK